MSLRDLAFYQEELLVRLVRHAHDRLDFYRSRLQCLFTANGRIDLARWNSVPILRRDDVMAHGGAMRLNELASEYGAIGEFRTSGSTGIPLPIASNNLVFVAANALFTRMARSFGIDTARPLAAIRRFTNEPAAPYPEGRVGSGWSLADPDAPLYELELMTPVEQQLEWLARNRAPYLLTQPSGALAIAHAVTPEQGRALGIEIAYAHDGGKLLGTGGALRHALPLLGEQFMVLYGDSYLMIDYADVVRAFERSGQLGLMTVY